ncbi:hypothetical protein DEA8626_00913 [Defluviimonas aquaemixtae]|uniref:Nucleotide-diphospho-sugar transferase domain-containing protein n=1 Tax=Albidovulum aquaemixtae TaxID=1542388 RepID=A0A2R8B482_9RHOB|nr:hypothetical protein [Defluviimonas aquaemixtae]SPH17395.1 hypothetical protein DEA8626_00913 [Defluviimonas aquaemixtae]
MTGRPMIDAAEVTLFFIVEPPHYQNMACYLAASIREQFGPRIRLVGYCPEHRFGEVGDEVVEALRRLDCDLRTFPTEGRFDPPYPHGNKILAALEARDTAFSGFMDSDILCLRPNRVENIVSPGAVRLTPAASMNWAPQSIWTGIYGACGMEVPAERMMLARQKRGKPRLPYYSSGFVTFPEDFRDPDGKRFPEVWMEVAQTIDATPDIPKKRPYLDQMSLPVAIRKSGLEVRLMDEEQHYILGGMLRGQPLPEDREIFTVHYRRWLLIKEAGLSRQGKDMLQRQAGVRRLGQIGGPDDGFKSSPG